MSHADLKKALHSVAERAGDVLAKAVSDVAEDCSLFEECDAVATVGGMIEGLTKSEDFRRRKACEKLRVRVKRRRPSLESAK